MYHLAEINIARMLYSMEDPRFHGFVSRLDEINSLAEQSKGFVWRLKTDDGDAMSIRAFDDDQLIINMSVWESIDDLYQYSYYTAHAELFKQRKDWFEHMSKPMMALWWVKKGHQPSLEEAKEKLELIQAHGPTEGAFSFKERFDPPAI